MDKLSDLTSDDCDAANWRTCKAQAPQPILTAPSFSAPQEPVMSAIQAKPVPAIGPSSQGRQSPPEVDADFTLVRLSAALREDQSATRRFDTIEPRSWDSNHRSTATADALIRRIADLPATGRAGLRAKAQALHTLLDEGGGRLYEDAAAPDQLAWSLVADILAD